jgi:DNA-binding PadR family transcriptional regulator
MNQRIRHHRRGGPFGGRFDPFGERFDPLAGGGPPFGPGPFGDVRLALLLLLSEEPRNGYQLMQEIEERSGGRWRPSPGSVYPSLAQLEDEGLIRVTQDGETKRFELTDAGREQVKEREQQTPPWVGEEDPASVADLRTEIKQLAIAAAQVFRAGDQGQTERVCQTLAEARRGIYRILSEDTEAGPRNV